MDYIIIDDEPLAREGVKLNADQVPSLNYLAEFGNPIQATEFLDKNKVDLVFLDIEMPGMTGLEFLKTVHSDFLVILTTAYPQFALEAYELDVIDYLVKPIRFERFFKAYHRAKEIYDLQSNQYEHTEVEDDFVYIKSDRKYVKLKFNEILYIKGMKDYVVIFTSSGKYMTAMNIKTIFSHLPDQSFARVSKSYIVNVDQIDSVDVDTIQMGEVEIPLGMSYKEAFLNTFIKGNLIKR